MNKFLNIINHILNWILNIVVVAGVAVLLAWFVWGIKPQESIMKTGYFFSNLLSSVTGKEKKDASQQPVTRGQLEESAQKTHQLYGR